MSIGKRLALIAAFLALPVLARADVVDSSDFKIPQVTVDPTGACINGASYIQTTSSHLWVCGLAGWIDVTGTGTGGSTTALDNLASVNINSALLAQASIDLGSTTKPFRNLYLYGAGTYSTTYLKLTGTPTSTRTLTIPDLTGTFLVRDDTGSGNGAFTFRKTTATAVTDNGGFVDFQGTLSTPVSGSVIDGMAFWVAGAGSGNVIQRGADYRLQAGYTGSATTVGLRGLNQSAGTGTAYLNFDASSASANYGLIGRFSATTAGAGVGVLGTASGGDIGIGGVFTATDNKANGVRVGVVGLAAQTTATPTTVGGYFGIRSTAPTFVSSVLQLDNAAIAVPILVAQDNGSAVKTIEDNGAEWGKVGTKTLTESSATLFARFGVPSNGRQGGVVEYCVDANDATDYQERCGSVPFSGSNKGGTETCAVGTPSDVVTETQGASTLTVSFDTETAGTNTCGIRANAASSLVQTTLQINYTVRMFGNAATAVTPQ